MNGAGAKTTLANAKGWFVFVRDGFIEVFLQEAVDNFVVGPNDEVRGELGFDDGPIVVIEKSEIVSGIGDVVVGGGAGDGWIHIRIGIGHCVLAAVHEDSRVSHGGAAGLLIFIALVMHWFSKWWMLCTLGRPMRGSRVPKLVATLVYSNSGRQP